MSCKVYVLVLNYSNWLDTIECLESLLRNAYPDYQVIVIDNNSPNKSMAQLTEWAEGRLEAKIKANNHLKRLSYPPVKKPLHFVLYKEEEAKRGGKPELEKRAANNGRYPLVFIQTDDNLGFAGGNNVGLRYALAKDDFAYAWILNNDTVIDNDALTNILNRAERYRIEHKKVGIVGSKLLSYDNPKKIQDIGGKYNKWCGVASRVGVLEEDRGQYDRDEIPKTVDYISGSSMFVSKDFIRDVGLMCEDYFLYFEELDWVVRGNKKWQIGYCWDSTVYHKGGRSINSRPIIKQRGKLARYYHLKNRIAFTKKFYPECLWGVYLTFLLLFLSSLIRGQFRRLPLLLKALWNA